MRIGYCVDCGKEGAVSSSPQGRFLDQPFSVWAGILRVLEEPDFGGHGPLENLLRLVIRASQPIHYKLSREHKRLPIVGIKLQNTVTIPRDLLLSIPRRAVARMIAARMARQIYRAIMEKGSEPIEDHAGLPGASPEAR